MIVVRIVRACDGFVLCGSDKARRADDVSRVNTHTEATETKKKQFAGLQRWTYGGREHKVTGRIESLRVNTSRHYAGDDIFGGVRLDRKRRDCRGGADGRVERGRRSANNFARIKSG